MKCPYCSGKLELINLESDGFVIRCDAVCKTTWIDSEVDSEKKERIQQMLLSNKSLEPIQKRSSLSYK